MQINRKFDENIFLYPGDFSIFFPRITADDLMLADEL